LTIFVTWRMMPLLHLMVTGTVTIGLIRHTCALADGVFLGGPIAGPLWAHTSGERGQRTLSHSLALLAIFG